MPSSWKVTATSLNLRQEPSLDAEILAALPQGTVGGMLVESPDGDWLKLDVNGKVDWCWKDYLEPMAEGEPTGLANAIRAVCEVVDASSLCRYGWQDRGLAPAGYLRGMGLAYLHALGRLGVDPLVQTMAAPWDGGNENDVLHHYAVDMKDQGFSSLPADSDRLKMIFTILIGLGMRESSGRWCEGRDRSASNTEADTAESGLFQTSWDIRYSTAGAPALFAAYQQKADPFAPIFKAGIQPHAHDLEVAGTGDGACYQMLAKEKPTFSVLLAALGLRSNCRHWGPIIRHEAEVRPEAAACLTTLATLATEKGLLVTLSA